MCVTEAPSAPCTKASVPVTVAPSLTFCVAWLVAVATSSITLIFSLLLAVVPLVSVSTTAMPSNTESWPSFAGPWFSVLLPSV